MILCAGAIFYLVFRVFDSTCVIRTGPGPFFPRRYISALKTRSELFFFEGAMGLRSSGGAANRSSLGIGFSVKGCTVREIVVRDRRTFLFSTLAPSGLICEFSAARFRFLRKAGQCRVHLVALFELHRMSP